MAANIDDIKSDINKIKTDIALIAQEQGYIKERLGKVEYSVYSVGAVIILAVLGVIINFFVRIPK